MQIHIQATRLDLTPAVKEYIEEKIGSLDRYLKRFQAEGEVPMWVEIARSTQHHKQGDVFYAEVTLRLPGKTLRAEHFDSDIRAAIDAVKDVMKIEIKKYKEKVLNSRTRRARNRRPLL